MVIDTAKKINTNFQVEQQKDNCWKIIFSGRLDINSVASIWSSCMDAVDKHRPSLLILDFQSVNYCDGAGIALIQALQNEQKSNQCALHIENLLPDFKNVLNHIEEITTKEQQKPLDYQNIPEQVGQITVDFLKVFYQNITFLGAVTYQLFYALTHPKKIRWQDLWRIMDETGPQALPIIALIGFLLGLISTFQAEPSFRQFGMQIYLVRLVCLGLVREMGPLLTSVLLAGRTASSFAAEIGTMKINQEIDALKTMGLDPVRFLVVPRILATIIITPILEIFFIIFGLLGNLVVMLSLGYSTDTFFSQINQGILPGDYIGGLVKVFVFGLVIAGVGCLHGIKTSFGAQAVGRSTTQAVVSSLIMLVVVDGIFALIYYVLKI